ncbi:hypothetical protein ABZZ47_38245 [Streptomyces sp. NPDC006465]|uniref:hypothetical protein n=1 Tax=Streptomyces sp. NPDC006465 TaxID=3157174 RepID=UPI0033B07D5A
MPKPVPKDLPDQQAAPDEDPLDVVGEAENLEKPDAEVPDADEAGTGPGGAPHSGSSRPEHPVPDEPTD